MILSGGNDWLTYESFARDIRNGDLLLLAGAPLGQGSPFYYQVLYPYLLAAGHLLVGESLQGIVLLQLLGVALEIFLAVLSVSGPLVALLAVLMASSTGIFGEWFTLAGLLLSENVLLLVFSLLLFTITRLARPPTLKQCLLVGALMGVAVLTRATAWLAVPFLVLLLTRSPKSQGQGPGLGAGDRTLDIGLLTLDVRWARMGRVLALLLPVLALAALIPLRNLVAAGSPVLLPTQGREIVVQGLVPNRHEITTEPWLSWRQRHDPNLVAVAEAIANAPAGVAGRLLDKTAYVLGFPRPAGGPELPRIFWPMLLLWILAPLGFLRGPRSPVAWAALILAVTHCLSLVVVMSQPAYYYRYAMPATLPLAIWDALALASLLRGLPDRGASALLHAQHLASDWLRRLSRPLGPRVPALALAGVVAIGALASQVSSDAFGDDRAALAAFLAGAVGANDLLFLDAAEAFPRGYPGPAASHVVSANDTAAVLAELLHGRRRALFFERFQAGADSMPLARFLLEKYGREESQRWFQGYRLRHYALADVPVGGDAGVHPARANFENLVVLEGADYGPSAEGQDARLADTTWARRGTAPARPYVLCCTGRPGSGSRPATPASCTSSMRTTVCGVSETSCPRAALPQPPPGFLER